MKLYTSGLFESNALVPYVAMTTNETKPIEEGNKIETTNEDDQTADPKIDTGTGFDLFKHTRVDIDDK